MLYLNIFSFTSYWSNCTRTRQGVSLHIKHCLILIVNIKMFMFMQWFKSSKTCYWKIISTVHAGLYHTVWDTPNHRTSVLFQEEQELAYSPLYPIVVRNLLLNTIRDNCLPINGRNIGRSVVLLSKFDKSYWFISKPAFQQMEDFHKQRTLKIIPVSYNRYWLCQSLYA